MVRVLASSEVRRDLESVLDAVVEDRIAVVIRRRSGEPVVMMAQSEYDALMETWDLLRSPRNAERLREAIADVEAGDLMAVTLKDGALDEAGRQQTG